MPTITVEPMDQHVDDGVPWVQVEPQMQPLR